MGESLNFDNAALGRAILSRGEPDFAHGLLRRLALMDEFRDRWLMLNLYRSRGSEPFRDGDIACIRRMASLLTSLAGKHAALVAPAPQRRGRLASIRYLEELLAGIEERLT